MLNLHTPNWLQFFSMQNEKKEQKYTQSKRMQLSLRLLQPILIVVSSIATISTCLRGRVGVGLSVGVGECACMHVDTYHFVMTLITVFLNVSSLIQCVQYELCIVQYTSMVTRSTSSLLLKATDCMRLGFYAFEFKHCEFSCLLFYLNMYHIHFSSRPKQKAKVALFRGFRCECCFY